jgi:hypothetical protein
MKSMAWIYLIYFNRVFGWGWGRGQKGIKRTLPYVWDTHTGTQVVIINRINPPYIYIPTFPRA